MSAENVVFLFVLTVAAGFFALNVQRLVQYMRLGKPERRIDRPWHRVWNVLRVGIAQTKILREPVAGLMHATIFWGFIVLTAGSEPRSLDPTLVAGTVRKPFDIDMLIDTVTACVHHGSARAQLDGQSPATQSIN